MKKYTSVVLFAVIFNFSFCIAQDNDWELPLKNDLITFEYTRTFNNKKKDLWSYYVDGTVQKDLHTKVNAELSGKGGKLLSNTNYKLFFILGGGRQPHKKNQIVTNDTLTEGSITIIINKRDLLIRGTKHSFNTITCKLRTVMVGKNQYVLRLRGFSVGGLKANNMKGSIQSTEEYLEDMYKDFLQDNHKRKSDKEFYKDIKEVLNIFQTLLGDQIDRAIKVTETD
jgi:hypothetical protein